MMNLSYSSKGSLDGPLLALEEVISYFNQSLAELEPLNSVTTSDEPVNTDQLQPIVEQVSTELRASVKKLFEYAASCTFQTNVVHNSFAPTITVYGREIC
jgi:hypothetical protein